MNVLPHAEGVPSRGGRSQARAAVKLNAQKSTCRRLVKLRGWPTDYYMNEMRENPKDLAHVNWTAEDLAAWEAARAQGRTASSDPARPPTDDGSR